MSIGKWAVLGIWLFSIVGYLMGGESTVSTVATAMFWLLLVGHAVECVVFRSRLQAAGGSLLPHIVQTMVFGLFHIQTLPGGARQHPVGG